MKGWSMKGQWVILTPPSSSSFHFRKIFSWECYSKKAWVIPCHIVPFSERGCQPNAKREVMIHLGSQENHFPPPHPHFTVSFFLSLRKPQFLLQL